MKVAIIPARGGSKRIPRKNIRLFAGKPIIAWAIEAAIDSGLFDSVVVSTDDREIADVAKQHRAEIPFLRPKELTGDFTGTNAVVKHAIRWFNEHGQTIDYACCIYATAPFVRTHYLKEGFDKLVSRGKSYAFSVTSFPFPVQRALRLHPDGCVEAIWPENIFKRSQDLEEAYHDAGQFYWGTAQAFLEDVVMYSPASLSVVLPRELVQDIDTLEDWYQAEILFQMLKQREKSQDVFI